MLVIIGAYWSISRSSPHSCRWFLGSRLGRVRPDKHFLHFRTLPERVAVGLIEAKRLEVSWTLHCGSFLTLRWQLADSRVRSWLQSGRFACRLAAKSVRSVQLKPSIGEVVSESACCIHLAFIPKTVNTNMHPKHLLLVRHIPVHWQVAPGI